MTDAPTWSSLLTRLIASEDLSVADASWAMEEVLQGRASDAQLGAFLVALRIKGETVDEVVGFRDSILASALPLDVDPMALDIVGTGGDRFGTVNVSTTASIVAASAGVPVVKHGNRAASSSSGSSDVLGALGVNLDLEPEGVARVLAEAGITFVFASKFHAGFRHAGPVRSQLGIPTVFNFLGPLSNPARPEANAIGVAVAEKAPLVAGVFRTRGATALVFRGDEGLDELSTIGHSRIWEVTRGELREHDLDPRDLGIARATLDDLIGGSAEHNAQVLRAVLAGETGPVRDIVLLNAAAGLVSFELANDQSQLDRPILERLAEKLVVAAEAVDSGAATATLERWVSASRA